VTRAAWAVWPAGLTRSFTLPEDLPPLRLLLVWDNLAGPKTPDLVLGLCAQGVMPLSTPVGGSWLNMAESIERVLKRRALDGQPPHRPDEIGSWFEQTARGWNEQPTPFVWNGKRRPRRRSGGEPIHRLGGSGARTHKPLKRSRSAGAEECQSSLQVTHSYVRLQGFWAKQFSSGPCRSVLGDGIQLHGMGDGALRRRSIKLLSAGWLPHSVFRLGASPV
jgi:hypothetical protein